MPHFCHLDPQQDTGDPMIFLHRHRGSSSRQVCHSWFWNARTRAKESETRETSRLESSFWTCEETWINSDKKRCLFVPPETAETSRWQKCGIKWHSLVLEIRVRKWCEMCHQSWHIATQFTYFLINVMITQTLTEDMVLSTQPYLQDKFVKDFILTCEIESLECPLDFTLRYRREYKLYNLIGCWYTEIPGGLGQMPIIYF